MRSYVLWIVAVAVSTLSVSIAFSIYVNGLQTPVGKHFDAAQLQQTDVRLRYFSLEQRNKLDVINNSTANTLLIGSSRVKYGFDTCATNVTDVTNLTNVTKVGLAAISYEQVEQLVDFALQLKPQREIFIEIGLSDSTTGSFELATHLGLKELTASYSKWRQLQHQRNCQGRLAKSSFHGVLATDISDRYSYYAKLNDYQEVVAGQLDKLSELVENRGGSAVFFIAPIHPDLVSAERVNEFVQGIERLRQRHDFPILSFTEVFSAAQLKRNELWYDANHFYPDTGARFLRYLKSYAQKYADSRHAGN